MVDFAKKSRLSDLMADHKHYPEYIAVVQPTATHFSGNTEKSFESFVCNFFKLVNCRTTDK